MTDQTQKVQISINADRISLFHVLLSYGFILEVDIGTTLLDLLVRQAGIKENFLNEKVQTVFLNGVVVDDLSVEMVQNGSVIALSAAMPGLAGAVFRKGGILSSLRSDHAEKKENIPVTPQKGEVRLKLFNLIASELGAYFLQKGIRIQASHFMRFVGSKQAKLPSVCRQLVVDGRHCRCDDILILCRPKADIFLTVTLTDKS